MSGSINSSTLMSILEMAKGFQKEIAEMKETMRSNHQEEIRRIEQNFALEKQQIKETYEHECRAYKIDIGQKNVQISNLNNAISGKNNKIDSLEKSINAKVILIEGLQQTIQENNRQIVILQTDNNKNAQEKEDLKRINSNKEREYEKIKNTLNEKNRENGNLQTRLNIKENENRDLKVKLENKDHENTNLKISQTAKIEENELLERRLREANQKIDSLNSCIHEKTNENRRLKSIVDSYNFDPGYDIACVNSYTSYGREYAKEITKKAVDLFGENMDKIATYVKDRFNEKYNVSCHCYIHKCVRLGYSDLSCSLNIIYLRTRQYFVLLFWK